MGGVVPVQCVAAVLLLACGATVSVAQLPQGPAGALRGIVRDTSGQPVAQVRVSIGPDTSRFTTSDANGAFFVPGIAAGAQRVHFRRLGYVPADFTVSIVAGEELRLRVELSPLTERLEPIEVSRPFSPINPSLERSGFYERRRQRELGILAGTFIDPEQIAARRASQTTYLLEGVSGMVVDRTEPRSGGRVAVPRGRAVGRTGQRCQMAVFLDGRELDPRDVGGGLDQLLNPFDVAAIEVYPSASGAPERFQSTRINNPCGSIVIWTKGG